MQILDTRFVLLLVVFALLTVLATLARRYGRRRRDRGLGAEVRYEARPGLLTPAERSFFGVLQVALGADYQIFAKVRLADVVRPVQGASRSGWQAAFNRICGKHVDFVICGSGDLAVVAVVELDDQSHERFERGMRDGLVDRALAEAGIPVLRVSARRGYSPGEIRDWFQVLRAKAT